MSTPHGTNTWFPLPHRDLLEEVQTQLESAGFTVGRESHALSHEGHRYFGVIEVTQPGQSERDYAWVVGLRNSHEKTFPAGLVAGTSVFTCDNLAFSGELKISRKHTRFATRDLRHLTARAVGKLGDRFHGLDHRIDAYRDCPVPDWAAHDLVIRAMDCRAITPKPIFIFSRSKQTLSSLPKSKSVHKNTFYAFRLPTTAPPCFPPLAARPPWLGRLPRRLRKAAPQIPRPAPTVRKSGEAGGRRQQAVGMGG